MASLLDSAQALLGDDAWEQERALSAEIALERLEAAYLLREFDDVEARALACSDRPLPEVARLSAQEIRVALLCRHGPVRAGNRARDGRARGAGHRVPRHGRGVSAPRSCKESAELDRWLEHDPDAFDRMPLDPSPEHRLIDALMTQAQLCAIYGGRPMLSTLVIARVVSEAIRRGALTPAATLMICSFANAWSVATGMYRRTMRWVTPGVRAAERVGSPMLPECLALKAIYLGHSRPIDEAAAVYEQAIAAGLKIGSFQGTSWGLFVRLVLLPRYGVACRSARSTRSARRAGSWCSAQGTPSGDTTSSWSRPGARS